MKTLSQIIKEIFSVRSENRVLPAIEKQSSINYQTTKKDETETHEISGDSRLDSADAPKSDGLDQTAKTESEESEPLQEPGMYGESGEPGELADSGESGESGDSAESLEYNLEEALKEAYEKGRRDARNEMIEQKYFPKRDDGIPHFHGTPPRRSTSTTGIFSLAREA